MSNHTVFPIFHFAIFKCSHMRNLRKLLTQHMQIDSGFDGKNGPGAEGGVGVTDIVDVKS